VADAVWDEAIAGHLTPGSTGEELNTGGSAGDPWGTTVPAAYEGGTAGYILGTNLDTTVSSRSSHSAAAVWAVGTRTLTSFGTLVADIWANATRTLSDKTGFALTAGEHTNIADALLKRDWTAVTGEAARSVLNALRFLRNKWSVSGTTLTVTEENDATVAWQADLSTTPGAEPVTGVDPS
jgi:hypothetical protein